MIADALSTRFGGSFGHYRRYLKRGVVLRINAPSTGLAADDLEIILSRSIEVARANSLPWDGPDYICVPKTETIDELRWVNYCFLHYFAYKIRCPIAYH